jgi:hypothetical protein
MTCRQFKLRFKASFLLYIESTSKDQETSFWSSSIAILFPFHLFYLPESSPLYWIVHFISSLISPLLFIYYLSILVEVLLRLLTYRGDLVLLYLVSEDHS